jgi:hypothetical protein
MKAPSVPLDFVLPRLFLSRSSRSWISAPKPASLHQFLSREVLLVAGPIAFSLRLFWPLGVSFGIQSWLGHRPALHSDFLLSSRVRTIGQDFLFGSRFLLLPRTVTLLGFASFAGDDANSSGSIYPLVVLPCCPKLLIFPLRLDGFLH